MKSIRCISPILLASVMSAVGVFGATTPIVVLKSGSFVNTGNVSATAHTIANFEVPAGTAGLDKKLVVTCATESPHPISVSWGGISLTNVAATANSRKCSVWYADAVPPGTNNVVVTMDQNRLIGAINAVTMEGAKPGVALTSVLNDTTGTLITNDVTIASTNTLLVGIYQNNRRGIFLNYWGGGTAISLSDVAGGIAHRGGYRKVALPGVETLAWSNGVSEVSAYAVAGFEEADVVIPEAPPTLTVSVLAKAKFENIAGTATNVFTLPDFGIPAGSDILDKKIVVVFGNKNNSGLDAQSITFGGLALTKAVSNTGVRKCSVWYLDSVTPGTTNDVVVTMPSASAIGTFNVFCLEGAKPGVTLTAKLDTVVAKTNTVTAIAVKNTLMVGLYQNDNGGTLYDYFNAEGFRYFGNINGLLYRSGYASVPETGLVSMKFINGKDLSSGAAIAGFEGLTEQTISNFTPSNNSTFLSSDTVNLAATASSGLTVDFSSSGDDIVSWVDSDTVTFTGHGSVQMIASVAAATPVTNTWTIQSVPVSGNVEITRQAGEAIKLHIDQLLAACSDAEGRELSITQIDSVSSGGQTIAQSGSWIIYQPDAGFVDADSFSFTVTTAVASATGQVLISVDGTSDETLTLSVSPDTQGNVQLQLHGIPGREAVIQVTDDLQGAWVDLYTNTFNTSGIFNFTDENAPSQRFYRLLIRNN